MNSLSNQTSWLIKAGLYPGTKIASGTSINTITALFTGPTNGGLFTDILFRNSASTTVNLNIIWVQSGNTGGTSGILYAGPYFVNQIQIPANAGSNGTTPLASLAALAPLLFDLDLAGNRIILAEAGDVIYVQNIAALTGDLNCFVKGRTF